MTDLQDFEDRLVALEKRIEALETPPDNDYIPAEYTCVWCGQTKKGDGYLLVGAPLCPECAGRKPTADKPAPKPGEVWACRLPNCKVKIVQVLKVHGKDITIQEWFGEDLLTSPSGRGTLLRPATDAEKREFWGME